MQVSPQPIKGPPLFARSKVVQCEFCLLVITLVFGALLACAGPHYDHMKKAMGQRYGDTGVKLLEQWHQLIETNKERSELQKITSINTFFNQHLNYTTDSALWGVNDYWATPLESMGKAAGDCEDYAIAKYLSLLKMGVPLHRLRLIYVRARVPGAESAGFQAHMVLGYYPDGQQDPYILDSLVQSLDRASKRNDLKPVFSFNSDGLWVGNEPSSAEPTSRLSRWRDVLARAEHDGFH